MNVEHLAWVVKHINELFEAALLGGSVGGGHRRTGAVSSRGPRLLTPGSGGLLLAVAH